MLREKKDPTPKGKQIFYLSYLFGPWHPPLAQFPIVCSILAVFSLWIANSYGIEWFSKAAGALWILTLATGLFSFLTGHFFAHRLERYTHWSVLPPTSTPVLHFHALLGTIALGLSVCLLPGALHLAQGQPVHLLSQFFLGIAAAVFFGWGAHEGGEMTFKMEMVPLSTPKAPVIPRVIHPKAFGHKHK